MDQKKCAVIDLGSNTVHLAVFARESGVVMKLYSKKESVGLMGFVESGAVTAEGERRLCSAVSSLVGSCREKFGIEPECIATAALRNVTNGEAVAMRVEHCSGVRPRIIGGEEEAALGLFGLLGPRPWERERGAVCDLGGGSCEITSFEHGEVGRSVSLPFGSMLLFRKFVATVLPDRDAAARIEAFLSDELRPHAWLGGTGMLFAIGGTARACARMHADLHRKKQPGEMYEIPLSDLRDMVDFIIKDEQAALEELIRISPDRLNTLPCGIIALSAIASLSGSDALTVGRSGIREGYACTKLCAVRSGV